ncbi:MAG TPA: EF-P beta-lysylation protein EpmB [Pirellulales bacterium]|jgi:EF-P beta-lysylation protein EpmB|nr:EF-P beta-lysylation protein EpmB [Pirellulales bacterium]
MSIVSVSVNSSQSKRDRPAAAYVSWQQALKDAVRDARDLCQMVGIPAPRGMNAGERDFPVFVPRGYIARMRHGDPNDPLLRQVLPLAAEGDSVPGYSCDPVGDVAAAVAPGLLHKYSGRVLIVATPTCAVHCRYCFRRHFPYAEDGKFFHDWQPALRHIEADRSIREVILSGGDPLTIVDERLAELARRLAAIEHVTRLRVHTRVPIMIPERVTDELIGWLRGTRLTPILVLHVNHAQEVDEHVGRALARLIDAGIPLLNQAVLLAGVNDNLAALVALSERLVALRIMPYYLHQLDPVAGAAHFEVDHERGAELVEQMRAQLPGYAVPRYVCEVAGAANKLPIV